MDHPNERHLEENDLSSGNFLVIIWIILLVVIICLPLCLNRCFKSIWCERLTSCRWNVQLDPEPYSGWYRAELQRQAEALRRHEALRDRSMDVENRDSPHASMQEKEELQQLLLLERLAGFTKTLEKKDFNLTEEVSRCHYKSAENVEEENAIATAHKVSDERITDHDCKATKKSNDDGVYDESFFDGCKVRVPFAGESLETKGSRLVSNDCAICLCDFKPGDRICWSSTAEDPHVFHETCLLHYFSSLGEKQNQSRNNDEGNRSIDEDNVNAVFDFPTVCPSCRQQFVSLRNKNNEESSERSDNNKDEVGADIHDDRYDV